MKMMNMWSDMLNRIPQKWELPNGIVIREARKIENIKIILGRIKAKKLLGCEPTYDEVLDIIEKVLDDWHVPFKDGKVKRGMKTMRYSIYIDAFEDLYKHNTYIANNQ